MAIGKLLRENTALVIGILLPVVVVVFFLLATYVPRLLVDPPQYDFLFVQKHTDYSSHPQSRWSHEIEIDSDGRLRVRAFMTEPEKWVSRPRLFLYEHLSGNVREIRLSLPEPAEAGGVVEFPSSATKLSTHAALRPTAMSFSSPARAEAFW